jgi:AcrR family transcriptional regulator
MDRKQELLQKISALFYKKGYEKTTIRDISRHLGMTNAGLYHHFKNKQEMLFDIMKEPMEEALVSMRQELPNIKNAEEKIAWIIRSHINYYSENKSQTKVLVHERGALEAKYAKIIGEKEREYVQFIKQVLGQILRESFHATITVEVATFCLLGMLNWLVHWYDPGGKVTPDELASNITTIFLKGVKAGSETLQGRSLRTEHRSNKKKTSEASKRNPLFHS